MNVAPSANATVFWDAIVGVLRSSKNNHWAALASVVLVGSAAVGAVVVVALMDQAIDNTAVVVVVSTSPAGFDPAWPTVTPPGNVNFGLASDASLSV